MHRAPSGGGRKVWVNCEDILCCCVGGSGIEFRVANFSLREYLSSYLASRVRGRRDMLGMMSGTCILNKCHLLSSILRPGPRAGQLHSGKFRAIMHEHKRMPLREYHLRDESDHHKTRYSHASIRHEEYFVCFNFHRTSSRAPMWARRSRANSNYVEWFARLELNLLRRRCLCAWFTVSLDATVGSAQEREQAWMYGVTWKLWH